MTEAIRLEGIHHRFGTTTALRDATLRVRAGSVHALLGENGAGKSTLMRVAFGLLSPDAGTMHVRGSAVRFRSSADAIAVGIGMVHQHFMLIPALTVAENVALGGHGLVRHGAVAAQLRALAARVGLPVDPHARVGDLAVGAQQRVEVLKALAHDARILILDEPTAVLTPDEAAQLLGWVRRFVADGGTAVLITHKLREALAHADEVTVLRRGETVLHAPAGDVDERALVSALTGAEAMPSASSPERADAGPGDPRLRLRDATVVDARGVTRLHATSLAVRAGEVLGVIGVEGSGHRELLRLLAGRLTPTSGEVVRPARVGFVPEDRLADALIPAFTLDENLALAEAGTATGRLDWDRLRARTSALIEDADVRAGGVATRVGTLSGGNQQKFVVAREESLAREALVVEHPTRGLDLVASARVLEVLARAAREHGVAVVVHSPDLDEVLAIATRVIACYAGRVSEVRPPSDPGDRTPYARALVGLG